MGAGKCACGSTGRATADWTRASRPELVPAAGSTSSAARSELRWLAAASRPDAVKFGEMHSKRIRQHHKKVGLNEKHPSRRQHSGFRRKMQTLGLVVGVALVPVGALVALAVDRRRKRLQAARPDSRPAATCNVGVGRRPRERTSAEDLDDTDDLQDLEGKIKMNSVNVCGSTAAQSTKHTEHNTRLLPRKQLNVSN
ncbi:hypothetical protein EYF80_042379 [Liparis tanakae]|uniref:Uncharacterized protein n=1 Tax=Liparis tanakae TaxID=230148 RepID=A0A4Z2G1L0_9TELE|nr:hypothetical protein EYF80_042379 [Liparis tanakae]